MTAVADTTRYGTATAMAWPRLHQRLEPAAAGKTTPASCPSSRAPSSGSRSITCPASATRTRSGCGLHAGTTEEEVNRIWQAFLRRFDIEHTFRFLKQQLGWTRPKLRDPAAADRWTWLVIAAQPSCTSHATLPEISGCPGSSPASPAASPLPASAGVRRIRKDLPVPASAPKPSRPGPGRPVGSRNQHPATRHDVGKLIIREEPKKTARKQAGKKLSATGESGSGRGDRKLHRAALVAILTLNDPPCRLGARGQSGASVIRDANISIPVRGFPSSEGCDWHRRSSSCWKA